eukprot:CAMPEP_0117428604 /NCGR_PEP_ID=MMETSP0758-20121206/8274_1 /TAXON_ID=63605 /ORGANISM="Percolomonas cosmopolitus, Strain AE-1 (ATCC 50343)" /LENGTH=284 /DNA_ID=CAMNT_0005215051 /DNA_START=59 /DNA_END=910 /DNA_ORIENTATION=-
MTSMVGFERIETLTVDHVIEFCFPPHISHPRTAARLHLLGRFIHSLGRRNEDGVISIISGNFRSQRILSDVELIGMIKEIEMEFLRSIYDKFSRIKFCKANEMNQMRSEAHKLFYSGLSYSKKEIKRLFSSSKVGSTSFDATTTIVAHRDDIEEEELNKKIDAKNAHKEERKKRRAWMYALKSDWDERVKELSKTQPNEQKLRHKRITDPKTSKVLPRKQAHDMETISDFRVLSRRLNHSHKITSVASKGNNTSTIQNILLMRDEKPSNKRLPWNKTCCFSKTV